MASSSKKTKEDRAIVSRLVEYAYRIFNTKMVDFFKRNCHVFEQSVEEQKRSGDTLEQYAVFQKYEEQLDKHMDSFVTKEGFKTIEQCFEAIDRALKNDKREHEERMNELLGKLKELEEETQSLRAQHALKIAKKSKKSSDSDNIDDLLAEIGVDDDAGAASAASSSASKSAPSSLTVSPSRLAIHTPQIMLLQPLTLEQHIEQVLNMADYRTFSTMMRIRAAHAKQMREMQEAAERRKLATANRATQLQDNSTPKFFKKCFIELRQRICRLTPKREDLQKDAEKEMTVDMLHNILEAGSLSAFRLSIKQLVRFIFRRLKMLCSPNHVATVQTHCEELLAPASLRKPCNDFIRQLLVYGHHDVDRIEKEIQAYMMWVSKMSAR